jgi:hypothetical protein
MLCFVYFEPLLSFLWKLSLAAFKGAIAKPFRARKKNLLFCSLFFFSLEHKNQALCFNPLWSLKRNLLIYLVLARNIIEVVVLEFSCLEVHPT